MQKSDTGDECEDIKCVKKYMTPTKRGDTCIDEFRVIDFVTDTIQGKGKKIKVSEFTDPESKYDYRIALW